MKKFITYYLPNKDIFCIEQTIVNYNNLKRPIIHGGYIINKNCIFETLEDAKKSLKTNKKIIEIY